ncbi:659_t:CDS:2 [Entrophospora sp. SA101]|nr:659_t:CDS:2 [Entrophospora sp. SA101]
MTIMISLLLLMFNLIGFVNGQDVTPTDITAPSPTTITTDNPVVDLSNNVQQLSMAQSIVVGVILLVIGFCYCFFGRKLYNLTLFILGSIIGSYVAFLILVRAEPPSGYTWDAVNMLRINGGLIKNDIARIVFIVAFAITGLILACIFEDVIIILGTSFIGAYAMILGVDMFANTGFRLSVRAFLDGTPYTTSRDVYLMLGGLIALFIAGSLIQYKFHRNHHFGPSHPKGYDKSVESGNGSDHAPVTEKKKGGYTGIFSKNKS